jgi:hypothetical protein
MNKNGEREGKKKSMPGSEKADEIAMFSTLPWKMC